MSNLNQINLIGRVGKTPEMKNLESGKVAKFSLAVSEKTTRNGERVEETEWFNVAVFGKTAEVVERYVNRGDLLFITGHIKTRRYQTKEGEDKTFTEVIVNALQMLGTKGAGQQDEPRPQATHSPEPLPAPDLLTQPIEDDLPF